MHRIDQAAEASRQKKKEEDFSVGFQVKNFDSEEELGNASQIVERFELLLKDAKCLDIVQRASMHSPRSLRTV